MNAGQVTLLSVIFLALQIAQTLVQEWIRSRKSKEGRDKITEDVATEVHRRLTESGKMDFSSTLKSDDVKAP